MARVLSTAFLVALLAATAVAFALTQGAKTELSPIYKTYVEPVFSPGNRQNPVGDIEFWLRKTDRLTVWMTRDGERVATIVSGRTYRPGRVHLVFTGVSPSGITLPDGVYVPVVRLGRSHRTITIPSEMRIDTRPPAIATKRQIYTHISPDDDGHRDVFTVPYTLNGPAQAVLTVNGRQVVVARKRLQGDLSWNGRFNGKPARPGKYTLRAAARDQAGNTSDPFPFALVTVRYVKLGRERVLARPGTHFAIRVLTDSPVVSWRILPRGRHGESRSHTLRLQAPKKPGVYRLYVEAAGHAARAVVVVA